MKIKLECQGCDGKGGACAGCKGLGYIESSLFVEDVSQAERLINAILAALEVRTSRIVEDITLNSVDETAILDRRKKLARGVCITFMDQPGMRWFV